MSSLQRCWALMSSPLQFPVSSCSPQQRRWKRSLLQPSLCALSCTVVPGPIAALLATSDLVIALLTVWVLPLVVGWSSQNPPYTLLLTKHISIANLMQQGPFFFYPHNMFLPWRRRMSWEAAMDVDVCVNVGWQNIKFILFPPLIHSWAISLIVISSFSVHKDEHFTSEATSTSKTSLAYSNSILVVARLIWPALLLNLRFHSSVSQRN